MLIIWRLNKLNVHHKFVLYLLIAVLTTAAITFAFGWWDDTSNQMLLEHYGYNADGLNDTERFGKVSSEKLERVKSIETSMMGIGWTLKIIIAYVFYVPYLLIVYLGCYFFKKAKEHIAT